MGSWYKCKCNNIGCGYEIYTSLGVDRGFYSQTKTMVCTDCKEIKEIGIGKYDANNIYSKIEELVCSTCEGKNLKDWDDESCPQCNNLMILDEKDQILWD